MSCRFESVLRFALLLGALAFAARAGVPVNASNPSYSAAGIVNAATQTPAALAPNTIATIYGTNLSWETYAIAAADLSGGALPETVQGVEVVVNGFNAHLFYVSPGQINFLIPYELVPGPATVYVLRDGVQGPVVTIQVGNCSPGLFEWNGNLAIAEHADGSLIAPGFPARPGEVIVLFVAGLGYTSPSTQSGRLATHPAQIASLPDLQVLLNGSAIPAANIQYAGLTPGFSGLYQINVQLPSTLPGNPAIQIAIGAVVSPGTVELLTQ